MTKSLYLTVAGAAVLAAALHAQVSTGTLSLQQNGWIRLSDWSAMPSYMNRLEGQSGPVQGRPFSGEEVRQSSQSLADGTQVKNSDSSKFYRDTEGRMRSESTTNALIYDPVAGFTYTLDLARKTFTRSPIHNAPTAKVSIAAIGNRTSISSSSSTSTVTTNSTYTTAPMNRVPAAPGKAEHKARMDAIQNQSVTEDLPPQTVNGVYAKGSRITSTIPAGTFGNDRDVKVVNERWYSDDLQVLVKSSNSDPRFGVTTYELTNILQAPPDPALFQVPADFTASTVGEFRLEPQGFAGRK